ncbi:hypothetical protein EUGRSUZ_J02670 [Eucalyptus grandis]|uniref:Uncharacterized protein n=2 Tax=Eucalyptus grandis TaxID=71139 RepID=A0ACC3J9Z5_EUCGR|nr:hypothetical protein EUGRSUZ_J02670 [Eucalyptus grandis]
MPTIQACNICEISFNYADNCLLYLNDLDRCVSSLDSPNVTNENCITTFEVRQADFQGSLCDLRELTRKTRFQGTQWTLTKPEHTSTVEG